MKMTTNTTIFSGDKFYNLFLDDQRDLAQAYRMTLDKDYEKLNKKNQAKHDIDF